MKRTLGALGVVAAAALASLPAYTMSLGTVAPSDYGRSQSGSAVCDHVYAVVRSDGAAIQRHRSTNPSITQFKHLVKGADDCRAGNDAAPVLLPATDTAICWVASCRVAGTYR